jgi:hypothetical protein
MSAAIIPFPAHRVRRPASRGSLHYATRHRKKLGAHDWLFVIDWALDRYGASRDPGRLRRICDGLAQAGMR